MSILSVNSFMLTVSLFLFLSNPLKAHLLTSNVKDYVPYGRNSEEEHNLSHEPTTVNIGGIASSSVGGRSPQCTKSSKAWDKIYLTENVPIPPMTKMFEDIPILSSIFPLRTSSAMKKGNPTTTNPNTCCGICSVYWPEVTVHYWPNKDSNTECLANIASDGQKIGSQIGLFSDKDPRTAIGGDDPDFQPGIPKVSRRTVHAPIVTPSPVMRRDFDGTVVVDGKTFHSPAIYLEIPVVHARDDCGPVGEKYSTVLWSYQPVDISSVVPDKPDCWPALLGFDKENYANCEKGFKTKSFNFADLPCPPDSLRAEGSSTFIYDLRVEYEPMLMQPWRMHDIDKDWTHCSANIGWDPYMALTPAAGLLPRPPPECKGEKGKKHGKKCKRGRYDYDDADVDDEESWNVQKPQAVPAQTTSLVGVESLRARTQIVIAEQIVAAQTPMPTTSFRNSALPSASKVVANSREAGRAVLGEGSAVSSDGTMVAAKTGSGHIWHFFFTVGFLFVVLVA